MIRDGIVLGSGCLRRLLLHYLEVFLLDRGQEYPEGTNPVG